MAIITISRGSMSGGEALAQCLAKTLNYPILGREILVEAAAKLGVKEETLVAKFEKSPSLWARLTSERRLYLVAVQAELAERCVEGNLVYHGHAGHLLLKGIPNVLRVRLIAPIEMRIRTVMEKQRLTRKEAEEYIKAVDEERIRWTKFIYGVDWRDPSLYDIIINLEKLSIETACGMIADVVTQKEFEMTEQVKKTLNDFILACRIRNALASDNQTKGMELEVRCNDGVAEISGEMPAPGMLTHTSSKGEQEIRRVVSSVPGVKSVHLNVTSFDAYH